MILDLMLSLLPLLAVGIGVAMVVRSRRGTRHEAPPRTSDEDAPGN